MTSPIVRADFCAWRPPRAELAHRVDDAPLHGLQAVRDLRQRAVEDHVHGVIEVGLLGEGPERDALDALEIELFLHEALTIRAVWQPPR